MEQCTVVNYVRIFLFLNLDSITALIQDRTFCLSQIKAATETAKSVDEIFNFIKFYFLDFIYKFEEELTDGLDHIKAFWLFSENLKTLYSFCWSSI